MKKYFKLGDTPFQVTEVYDLTATIFEDYRLDLMMFGSNKFGGPFAITTDEYAVVPKDNDKHNLPLNNICLFKNNGTLFSKLTKAEIKAVPITLAEERERKKALKSVPLKSQFSNPNPIIAIDFFEDDTLLVVLKDGTFISYDPTQRRPTKAFSIAENYMTNPIVESAKTVGFGIVFYTTSKVNSNPFIQFHYIKDFFDEVILPIKFVHETLAATSYTSFIPLVYVPISPDNSFSGKLECLVNDPIAGVIRLVDGEKEKVDFGNQPGKTSIGNTITSFIGSIKLIAVSGKGFGDKTLDSPRVALLTPTGKIYVYTLGFSTSKIIELTYDPTLGQKEKDIATKVWNLYWVGISGLVLTIGSTYCIISMDNEKIKKDIRGSRAIFCVPEIDGLRIISNKKCEILRELSEEYKGIFLLESSKSCKDLYDAYRENEERKPSPSNKILQNKQELEKSAIEDCINAATFEMNGEIQKDLLKAAAFGKSFLNANSSFQHDKLPEVCKKLRVLNALRSLDITRAITYQQFSTLLENESNFVNILLKYHQFYLADEVAKHLVFSSEITSNIYISWACAKIDNDEPYEKISLQIFERLKNDKSISFVEIAHRAFEKKKPDLAKKLMDYESSVYKKVPVLIWLGEYEKALKEACDSKDPNLIDLVVLRMLREEAREEEVLPIVLKSSRARPRLYKYYKEFYYDNTYVPLKSTNSSQIDIKGKMMGTAEVNLFNFKTNEFMMKFTTDEEKVCYSLWRCFFEKKEIYERGVKNVVDLDLKDKLELIKNLRIQVKLKDQLKSYDELITIYEDNLNSLRISGQTEEKPIMVRYCNDVKISSAGINDMQKKFKISEKMVFISKVKTYAENPNKDNIERLDLLLKKHKKELISFFDLATIFYEKGLLDKAEIYGSKIPDLENQIRFLKVLKTSNSLRLAVESAIQNKKVDMVKDLEIYMKNAVSSGEVKVDEEVFVKMNKYLVGK